MLPSSRRRAAIGFVTATLVTVLAAPAALAGRPPVNAFVPLATFDVTGEVAEIVAATPDGETLVYTDSAVGEVGFVDISDPAAPEAVGTLPVDGSPTAVAITPSGAWAIVAVDTSNGDFVNPSGTLVVVDLATRAIARTIEVVGQPDSAAVSPDGRFAAIAVENQRNEDLGDGGLPQLPAGFLLIVDLVGEPAAWATRTVSLVGLAGLDEPTDPEPEFVDIDSSNRVAVTLQENNAVAVIDLASGGVLASWSAGTSTHAADTEDDDVISFTDTISEEREPDAIQWTPSGNLLTANEGDLNGGSRDFSIFTPGGSLVFDAGASLELAAAGAGLYPDGRSDNLGVEPEGAEIATFRSHTFAFIGAERADFVAVYRLVKDDKPMLVQFLETGSRPEGLIAITSRDLFVSANEDDGTISIFGGTVQASAASG